MIRRIKSAARLLLRGDSQKKVRGPIRPISAAEIEEVKEFFPREKFFIFGHARSGTTLLTRLVRLHPDVHCNYQAHFFTRRPLLRSLVEAPEVEEWLTRKSNRWNHGRDLSPLVLRAVGDFILEREALKAGKRIVGDKSPSSTIHGQAVRDLHALYPDARLVYLIRDGRDVVVSERLRNFVEQSQFLSAEDKRIVRDLQRDPDNFVSGKRSILSESMLRRVAGGWATDVLEIDAAGRELFGKRYCALRYEDVVGSPVAELAKLWKFLGAKRVSRELDRAVRAEMRSNPDEDWQTRRNGALAAFLSKGRSGNWRQLFSARDKALFKDVAGSVLIKWKYEDSANW